jgi:hypothetical protein
VPEADVSGLAALVVELLARPDDYHRRRTEGLRLAETRTWTEVGRRHAALYKRVLDGKIAQSAPLASLSRRRVQARREFGRTAEAEAGARPFALPWLRRGGPVASALAASIDAAAWARAQLMRGRS